MKIEQCIKLATVSRVDYKNACVDVLIENEENTTCFDVALMDGEYKLPQVNDQVVVLFLPEDTTQGFVIGRPFCDDNKPPVCGFGVYHKQLTQDIGITADKTGLLLTGDLLLTGNVRITGNLTVEGRISAKE